MLASLFWNTVYLRMSSTLQRGC